MESTVNNKESMLKEVNDALEADGKARSEQQNKLREEKEAAETKVGKIPRMLRMAGAAILIGAAGAFLLQHWNEGNHVTRYFYFLIFSVVLAGAGFFSGIHMKDDKGARTLLAVFAAIVPVHFAQIGALLYSGVNGTGLQHHYPSYAYYVAGSLTEAIVTMGVAIPVLIVLTMVAFLSLVRSHAKVATVAYLSLNTLLLIPARDADWIAAFSIAACAALVTVYTFFKKLSTMNTQEGYFIKVMLAVPLVLLLGRTYNLYADEITPLFMCANFMIASLFLMNVLKESEYKGWNAVSQFLGSGSAICAWICFTIHLNDVFAIRDNVVFMLRAFPICGITFLLSEYVDDGKSLYRKLAGLMVLISTALQLLLYPEILSSVVCIVVSIPVFCVGYIQKERAVFFAGICGLLFGLAYQLRLAMDLYSLSPWLSLACVGVVTILVSSYIEMNRGLVLNKYKELKGHFGG